MRRVLAVAHNTFRETFRDRVVWVIFGFALLLVVLSNVVAYMSTPGKYDDPVAVFSGVGVKIVADVGLVSIWALSVLIAIFIGTGMIHKEVDKRTVYTILSRPVYRWEFIAGKYIGLVATLALLEAGMSAFFLAHYALKGGQVDAPILQALFMIFVEVTLVTALAVFFGSVGSPVLSAIMTFFVVLIGHMAPDIVELAVYGEFRNLRGILYYVYLLVPHLHFFNLRNEAVHHVGRQAGMFLMHLGYAAVYDLGLLALAVIAFRRRNL